MIAARTVQKGIKLFVGMINLETGVLNFCNRGHVMPMVVSEEFKRLEAPITRLTGNMLFFYNDALTAATNGEQKIYGEKKMLGAALQAMKLNPAPKPFTDYITDHVSTFMGGAAQESDITMVTIRFK